MTAADAADDDAYALILDDDDLARLMAYGSVRDVDAGEVLFRPGDVFGEFLVVIEGAVEIVLADFDDEIVLVTARSGQFIGELSSLTEQRKQLTARVSEEGRLLVVPLDELRHVFAVEVDLSDLILRTFMARSSLRASGPGAAAIRVVGSRFSSRSLALRAFLVRSSIAHQWIDLDGDDGAALLLERLGVAVSETPVVVTGMGVLRNPTPGELAEQLGLTFRPMPGHIFDLVVVGAGPAGLAAAVYGASEGLDTVLLESVAAGGQAGTSSRIENYLGFPNGVSGLELTQRAVTQVQKFGARLALPCEVTGVQSHHGWHVVELADGSEIPTRGVIVATGAEYRKPAVERWAALEGAGIYYAATETEARLCVGASVAVLGGGNSAGQAAIYLSHRGCHVRIVIRGSDLEHSMSRYLVDRVHADPHIELVHSAVIRELHGEDRLQGVTVEHSDSGSFERLDVAAIFCFIGAAPATRWLGECLQTDEDGFIRTDRDLVDIEDSPAWLAIERRPLPFETSEPGIFAVGDVRARSTKRVAAAVGEGSTAVRSVHDHLAAAH